MFKFPPFLTEQWASAYFQILFSVLVFAIGIPFLGLQLIMQEDVRHVVTYRQWKVALWLFLVFLLFVSAISFIWFLHPGSAGNKEQNNRGQQTVSANGVIRSPAQSVPGQPQEAGLEQPAISPQPNKEAAAPQETEDEDYMQALVAGIIVSVIPVLALGFGYWLPKNYTRKTVIIQFRDDLLEELNCAPPIRGVMKKIMLALRNVFQGLYRKLRLLYHRMLNKEDYFVPSESLAKLAYLGEHGNPGIEKKLVIDALSFVTRQVQTDAENYTYKGRELAQVIKSFGLILEDRNKPGNDDNFQQVAQILKRIWSTVSGKFSNKDASLAASMLKQLGLIAIREKSEETALIYVLIAAECDDSVVFELGLAAFNAKRFRIATQALNKLEVLTADEHPGEIRYTETSSNLLGLLSHYNSSGSSAKKRANRFFSMTQDTFSPSLEDCVDKAINYHYTAGNFDTADQLMILHSELVNQKALQL